MKRRILLIDDDRLQFRLTQAHFKNFRGESFDLDWAETYEEGLAQLLAGKHAACLLDYQLGERNGLALIREAVAGGSHTPIVFLTAESSERIDIEAMNAGALDYLVKDEISSHSLERSLRYALKLAETLEALRQLATRDQLTGMLNRREFDRILAEEEERSRRFGYPFSLVMLDIDHFKSVNDTHGHQVGDLVLQAVAARISGGLRTVDRVARFGGEEFALILMQADGSAVMETAKRACAAVAAEPIPIGPDQSLKITVSVGSAEMPANATTGAELVAAADKALYAAKSRGRNRAVAFSDL
ncbi:MAG: Two-component response regulator [Verrucomicrobia bacterium]|jgi:two-component system, cell cycle response regulator|nr:MAG: Two-component response regulator [Verrucomicrobiota bacterium]